MSSTYDDKSYKSPGVWQECNQGNTQVKHIVFGGNEANGEPLYVGRAMHSEDCIPGKVNPSHGTCYVSYGGQEHGHKDYQVLTNPEGVPLVWVRTSGGQVPLGAIQGGEQEDGQKLFIGRANYGGSVVVGKVHPTHKTLYIPFGGNEVPIQEYEVLVCRELNL